MKNDELRAKTWIGVVPTWTAYGTPIESPENRVEKVNIVPFGGEIEGMC